jgi:ketosteroid isomerase-like protein
MGPVQSVHDAGRLAWGFGPAGEPPRVTGVDVILMREGRIAALYTFLDPA